MAKREQAVQQQWLTAIKIYDMAVCANIEEAMGHLAEGFGEDDDAAIQVLKTAGECPL